MKYFFYFFVFATLCIAVNAIVADMDFIRTSDDDSSGSGSGAREVLMPSTQDSSICSNPHQPFDFILLLVSSVSLKLDVDMVTSAVQDAIVTFIADLMTSYCSVNCESCRMASTCADFYSMCSPFTSSDIGFSIRSDVVSRARQTDTTTTTVSITVSLPAGAPLLTSTTPPILPASVLASTLSENQEQFADATGVGFLGADPNYGISAVLNFDLIATIVLPIVVVLLVTTLVLGVIITLIISCVIKSKIKNKVGSGAGGEKD